MRHSRTEERSDASEDATLAMDAAALGLPQIEGYKILRLPRKRRNGRRVSR